jgi:hypothetical protein
MFSFHSLISFLPSLLNHSTAISKDSLNSDSIMACNPHCISPGQPPQKTPSLNNTSIVGHCRGNVFAEQLPSNGRLIWLHSSGLQPSCHNITLLLLVCFNWGCCYLKRRCLAIISRRMYQVHYYAVYRRRYSPYLINTPPVFWGKAQFQNT